jgi:hypothetical protein
MVGKRRLMLTMGTFSPRSISAHDDPALGFPHFAQLWYIDAFAGTGALGAPQSPSRIGDSPYIRCRLDSAAAAMDHMSNAKESRPEP